MAYTRILRKPIQLRIDDEEQWSYFDPTLLDGEVGLVRGTDNFKIGDGIGRWSQLELKTFGGEGGSDIMKVASTTTHIYCGFAPYGSSFASSVWFIMRTTKADSTVAMAYDVAWDDRESVTYG
jgi:hypothetical protein